MNSYLWQKYGLKEGILMKIGNRIFEFSKSARPVVMGILNVTPDSFSDGGKYNNEDAALYRVKEMICDGADIIDIGGESTRPGYKMISDEEEINRVIPIITKIRREFDIPISLDTYKAAVAEKGILAGVNIINDVWGLRWDGKMADVVAKYPEIPVIIMHNRKAEEGNRIVSYTDFIPDVLSDLRMSIKVGTEAGISKDRMIIDPGIGFAKTQEQNIIIMKNVDELEKLGMPILLGISRKSMIGNALDLPKDEREEGTIATNVYGYIHGCKIFRVHDVKKNRRALDMIWKIMVNGEKSKDAV